jgi:NhaP-type Na+/H+ or K+/H+ antiporter
VFASALLNHEAVPERLRKLLAIESGVNDGLALPLVVVLLALSASKPPHPGLLGLEVVSGIGLGVALTWTALKLEGSRFFGARASYRPLGHVALAITLYGLCELWHFNEFLAAFAAGATVATVRPEAAERLRAIGEPLAELLKLAAVFLFGALITPALLGGLGWTGWLFVALALLVARPAALLPALAGSGLSRREWWAAAWFGPKGFASVVYALLVLAEALPEGERLFHLVAATTAASMVAHSSTDVLVARVFRKEEERRGRERGPRDEEPPQGPRRQSPEPTA